MNAGRAGRGGPAGRPRRGLRRHVRRAVPGRSTRTSSPGDSVRAPLRHVRRRPRRDARRRRHRRERPRAVAGSTVDRSRRRPGRARHRGGSLDEARLPDRAVPGHAAHGGRRLGRRDRLRGPRDRLLAAGDRPDPALRRHEPHRRREPVGAARPATSAAEIEAKGLAISGLGFYPNPLHPDPAHRAAVIGHLKHVIEAAEKMDVPLVNTFMGGDGAKNQDENWEEALRVWPDIVALRPGPRPQDHPRELPDAVLLRRVAGRPQHRHDARGCGAGSSSSGAARSGSTSTRRT